MEIVYILGLSLVPLTPWVTGGWSSLTVHFVSGEVLLVGYSESFKLFL